MILVPITAFLLCLCVIQAWRRKWKNATLYLFAAAITFLTYELWAQSNINRWQRTRMAELNTRITEQIKELTEARNRTTGPTVPPVFLAWLVRGHGSSVTP